MENNQRLEKLVCETCHTLLDPSTAQNGVIACPSCGNTYILPEPQTPPEAVHHLRNGEKELIMGKFAEAQVSFQNAIELAPDDPSGYWGLAQAENEVRYIKDELKNRMQPICYSNDPKKFTNNPNYRLALGYANDAKKAEFMERATEIDYIKGQFQELKKSGLNFDCFICVKVSDPDNPKQKTADNFDADYIYDLLKGKGYQPFFSERNNRNEQGADYEARILYALSTAETMLVVCRNAEYLKTPWVKNEYSRFLYLQENGEKEKDALTFVYAGTPIDKFPDRPGKVQGFNMEERGWENRVVDFVERHTPQAKARREQEANRQKEAAAKADARLKSIEERLQQATNVDASGRESVGSLLRLANIRWGDGDKSGAQEFYEQVLTMAPENAAAWYGLFLIDQNCHSDQEINNKIKATSTTSYALLSAIPKNKNYQHARQFATGELAEQLQATDDLISAQVDKLSAEFAGQVAKAKEKYHTQTDNWKIEKAKLQAEEEDLYQTRRKIMEKSHKKYPQKNEPKRWQYLTFGVILGLVFCGVILGLLINYFMGYFHGDTYMGVGVPLAIVIIFVGPIVILTCFWILYGICELKYKWVWKHNSAQSEKCLATTKEYDDRRDEIDIEIEKGDKKIDTLKKQLFYCESEQAQFLNIVGKKH